ncbi:MAG: hypothetical protein GX256_05400 [Fretibacterium sp.]|nr:hypothetical protein [Fretibacterium sp.]
MPDESRSELQEPQEDSRKKPTKKARKRSRFMMFLLFLLLLTGVTTGLHLSGLWDMRPLFWGTIPKIPYVGEPLARFFDVPQQYTLNVAERRSLELEEWQKRLDERETLLSQQKGQLSAVSDDLEARAQHLHERESELLNLSAERSEGEVTEAEKNLINQVAKTYQDMSARNAAQIVEQLRENLAVELLYKLPVDARASILGKMKPQKAARLTELMARPEAAFKN